MPVVQVFDLFDLVAKAGDLFKKHARCSVDELDESPALVLVHEPDEHIRQSLSSIRRRGDLGLGRVLFEVRPQRFGLFSRRFVFLQWLTRLRRSFRPPIG